MLKTGDKIVLKNEMGAFKNIGEVCEITSVKDGIISFIFGGGLHLGCMSEDEFEKYFDIQKKAPSVTQEQIEQLIRSSTITTDTVFGKCTIVTVKLANGFILVESSACVSPENYNEKTGYEICMAKIVDKLWELEGYALQKTLYEDKQKVDYDW